MEVDDHVATGAYLTWSNRQRDNPIARELDRVLVNSNWLDFFPAATVDFLAPDFSDHSGILISLVHKRSVPKPFRFFVMWLSLPMYGQIVDECWKKDAAGIGLSWVRNKLNILKGELKKLNKDAFSKILERARAAENTLRAAQLAALAAPNQMNFDGEGRAREDCLFLLKAEESFFRQKARINSITLDDSNTAYFHKSFKARMARKQIHKLVLENEDIITDFDLICRNAVQYYEDMFGKTQSGLNSSVSQLKKLVKVTLSEDLKQDLSQAPTSEEIRAALFDMDGDKAPGPDGWTANFYQTSWGRIGSDVAGGIKEAMATLKLPKGLNAASLTLCPKKPNAETLGDFRPIACINVIYKIMAKLLAKRLQKVLPVLISKNQSAFIKGRSITDNILMALEIVQNYHKKGISSRSSVKVDLRKAFDSVD